MTSVAFGALPLPVPAPAAGQAVSDPALDTFLAFLKAVLNAQTQAAWTAIAAGERKPVNGAFAHNPEQAEEFSENLLPVLYGWREEGTTQQIASDYIIAFDTLRFLWVFPNTAQEFRAKRSPFVNAVSKAVNQGVLKGRDPAWKAPGDPEPQAQTKGSFLWHLAGLIRKPLRPVWKRTYLSVMKAGADLPAQYPAIAFDIAIQERLIEGGFTPSGGMQATLSDRSDPPRVLLEMEAPIP